MNYLLVVGTKDAGKSTTIYEVCKVLNPAKVWRVNLWDKVLVPASLDNIYNDTFLIEINGKMVLAVAGAPTEQDVKITVIIAVLIELEITIDFAVVAMRSYERKEGFDTREELTKFGNCILDEQIWQIEGTGFKRTKEWQERISRYVKLIESNS